VSLSDLESAPIDQVNSVGGEKLVQHFHKLRAFQTPLCAVAYTCRGRGCIFTHWQPASLQARGADSDQEVAAGDRFLS
jgi:hypothetical protein